MLQQGTKILKVYEEKNKGKQVLKKYHCKR